MPRPASEVEDPNGVPVLSIEEETTDQHNLRLITGAMDLADTSSGADPMAQLIDSIATAVAGKRGGGGDGGDGGGGDDSTPPELTLREIKKHKWLAAVLSLIFGSGGMVGTFYALKAQSDNNTAQVKEMQEAAKAVEPRITKNTDDIRLIKVDITDIGKNVGKMRTEQQALVTGVNTLKQEAQTAKQTRLEEKVKELERKNRQLERDSR